MKVTVPERYRKLRRTVPFDSVSLGSTTLNLTGSSELEAAQQGYSIVPEGDETDWEQEWLVIGNEDLCGDPIFIDTSDESYPVYTAAHGMGEWSPQLIASSFEHFIQILTKLRQLSQGRENPVQMEANPLTAKQMEELAELISAEHPDVDLGFWETIYAPDE